MMMRSNRNSWLFRASCKILKWFALFLGGFILFCSLSAALGALPFAILLMRSLGPVLVRLAFMILLLLMLAIFLESLRS